MILVVSAFVVAVGLALLAGAVYVGAGKIASALSGVWNPTNDGVVNADLVQLMAEEEMRRVKNGDYDLAFEDDLPGAVQEVR